MGMQEYIEESEKNKKVNWDVFKQRESNYLKLVSGQKVKIGFSSMAQGEATIHEKDDQGAEKVKTIPSLDFKVDLLDGRIVDMEFSCTSKKLIEQLRRFDERGILFSHVLEIERTGDGFKTQYSVFDCGEKAAAKAAGPLYSVEDNE